ncbi:ricin B-like lectin R40C1 isoform X2 [Oryza brachyantha]|uniref:ricin B-like lectin R40C1 isoform X2 n=1 Tax=Oryza brachyantha TaxID=4533 RepID=UPI00077656E7|nr:ricin B-like lectin R40C1 isoform X2 [Oryza brachyantha]
MLGGQPMRIYCKGDTGLNMAVRGDKVLLVPADSNDESQESDAVGKLTDDEERPAFALVNRTTGQAIVADRSKQLGLAPYSGHVAVEVPMLWSLGRPLAAGDDDDGGGFREIRMLRDVRYTLNGINGHVKPGTVVGIYTSEPASVHAVWKIAPVDLLEPRIS